MNWAVKTLATLAFGSALASGLTGCLDYQVLDDRALALAEQDAGAPGKPAGQISLQLQTGDVNVGTVAVRIIQTASGAIVDNETLTLGNPDQGFSITATLATGEYQVKVRGATRAGQVCSGETTFLVNDASVVSVPVSVHCDREPLKVGTAQVNVVDANNVVVSSVVVPVNQTLDTAYLDKLPPGQYVVWITATTSQDKPCAGSADLEITEDHVTNVDIAVICER